MSSLRMWMAAAVAVCVTGCADSGGVLSPIGPSPVAPTVPTVPINCALPTTPNNLSATVNGTAVSLAWSPVDAAADYVLHIGTKPSSSDVLLVNTSEASHAVQQMQPGTLYASVRSHNWCGSSDASEPIAFTVLQ